MNKAIQFTGHKLTTPPLFIYSSHLTSVF